MYLVLGIRLFSISLRAAQSHVCTYPESLYLAPPILTMISQNSNLHRSLSGLSSYSTNSTLVAMKTRSMVCMVQVRLSGMSHWVHRLVKSIQDIEGKEESAIQEVNISLMTTVYSNKTSHSLRYSKISLMNLESLEFSRSFSKAFLMFLLLSSTKSLNIDLGFSKTRMILYSLTLLFSEQILMENKLTDWNNLFSWFYKC